MIIIVCVVISIALGLWCWLSEGYYFGDFIYVLLSGVIGLFVGLLIILCAQPFFFNTQYNERLVKTVELIALEDDFGVQGSTYLFSTQINNELKYTFLYESTHGLTTDTIDADDAYLRNDATFPRIEIYQEYHPNAILNWLFLPGNTFYIIYIPENSIITNSYNIDLQ